MACTKVGTSENVIHLDGVHCRLLHWKAFGINHDVMPILNIEQFNDEPIKQYRSVMTVQQYNEIVCILTYWGGNVFLTSADEDNPEEKEIHSRFQRMNEQVGCSYDAHFKLLHTEQSNSTPTPVLLHKKTNGIVIHMLELFNGVIQLAHMQQGHLKIEKTQAALKPQYHSATYDHVKFIVDDCAICHKKNSGKAKKRGARKPIISSLSSRTRIVFRST